MSSSEPQAGTLKRKRQILPLDTPASQLTTWKSSLEQRLPLRVNRACNTCRRQKMRCDGPDKGSPCLRCKNSGVECVFEKVPPVREPVVPTTNHITSLESKMEIMQTTQVQMHNSIQEILFELRRRPVSYQSSEIAEPTGPSPIDVDAAPEAHKSRSLSSSDRINHQPSSLNSVYRPFSAFSNEFAEADSSSLHPVLSESNNTLRSTRSLPSPCSTASDHLLSLSSRPHTASAADHSHIASSVFYNNRPPSGSGSAPSGVPVSSVLGDSDKVAAIDRRLIGGVNKVLKDQHSADGLESDSGTVPRRRRLIARHVLREDGGRVGSQNDFTETFGTEDSSYIDGVHPGILSEGEAENLFDFFFEFCHPKMPIFDPKIDTFESLRNRSPFCLCCILTAATKTRDGGNRPSPLQLELWKESVTRAKDSMFRRVEDLEVIQGLLLLSAWSESTGGICWIVAGHAIRCSVEMGVHKALGRLASEGHRISKEVAQIFVSAARTWCALFALEYQLSFGIGRLTMTGQPKTVKSARVVLLKHPLSNPSDMRLVSACELLIMEYQFLDSFPNMDLEDPRTRAHLQHARVRMDKWHSEWDTLLSRNYPQEHYQRQTITIQRNYAQMAVHMACMQCINASNIDLERLTCWENEIGRIIATAARDLVKVAVEAPVYRANFRYSPTCFCSGISFAGASVLRLGAFLPGEEEYITSLTVELGRILEEVPTCHFKLQFMALLDERKRDRLETSTSASGKANSKCSI